MFFALIFQSAIVVASIAVGWHLLAFTDVLAIMYGASIALVNSGLLVRRWYVGLYQYHCDGERHLKSFHRSSMERFFVVGIMFAVGFGLMDLANLELFAGFIVGQLAWALSMLLARRLF